MFKLWHQVVQKQHKKKKCMSVWYLFQAKTVELIGMKFVVELLEFFVTNKIVIFKISIFFECGDNNIIFPFL